MCINNPTGTKSCNSITYRDYKSSEGDCECDGEDEFYSPNT